MKIKFNYLILFFPILFTIASSCGLRHSMTGQFSDSEVTQLIQNAPSGDLFPDADIIYILKENADEFLEDGRSKQTRHVVFKIIKDRGKNQADITVSFNSRIESPTILYARTITADGEIVPLQKHAVKVTNPYQAYPSYNDHRNLAFSMPGVTTGAIVEYKIVIQRKRPVIEGNFSERYYFQDSNPVLLSRYRVTIPQEIDLKYQHRNPLSGAQLSPRIVHQEGKKIYLWEYRNIPPIIVETSMPPLAEVAFNIMVTTTGSWMDFFKWWKKGIAGKTGPSQPIRNKVAELTPSLLTPEERVNVIFEYVKRQIRYVSIDLGKTGFEPNSASEVFENKYGDCKDKSTLLISMLKLAGTPAYYVLIPTTDTGHLIKDFPYPFQFDHCIVAIQREGEFHFMDPVAENYSINHLPENDQNRDVIIIKDQQPIFVKTPLYKPEENAVHFHQQIIINNDESLEGEMQFWASGDKEAELRSVFADSSPTEINEALQSYLHDIYPGSKMISLNQSDPLNFKNNFIFKMRFRAEDCYKIARDILIFQLSNRKGYCVSADHKIRRHPIVFQSFFLSKDEAEFNIPEGFELYYLPEPVEIINPYFEYRSNFKEAEGKIFFQGEFKRKATRILPNEYSAYKNSCVLMENSFVRKVLFKRYTSQ